MIAETFWQLVQDPGHWLFELFLMGIFDGLIGIVGVRLWRRWHQRHDEEVHSGLLTEEQIQQLLRRLEIERSPVPPGFYLVPDLDGGH